MSLEQCGQGVISVGWKWYAPKGFEGRRRDDQPAARSGDFKTQTGQTSCDDCPVLTIGSDGQVLKARLTSPGPDRTPRHA
ncbi:MAG: hypothetical protein JXM75_13045, partial [Chromatiaceae bacterium]|nr:hypothetical protein [Chromatiaceae bacterium]